MLKRTPLPTISIIQNKVEQTRNRLIDQIKKIGVGYHKNDGDSIISLIRQVKDYSSNFESANKQLFDYHMQNGNIEEAAQAKLDRMKLVYEESKDAVSMLNAQLKRLGLDTASEIGSYVSRVPHTRDAMNDQLKDQISQEDGSLNHEEHVPTEDEVNRQNFQSKLTFQLNNTKKESVASKYSENENQTEKIERLDVHTRHQLKCDLLRGSNNPFKGEAEKYFTWKNELQYRMTEAEVTAYDALQIVKAHCQDRPYKVVSSFIDAGGNDAEQILVNIFDTLQKRFGTSQQVASSLFSKIAKFPIIKNSADVVQLNELHDLCLVVSSQITNCDDLRVMNHELGMRMVWEKLPQSLQTKWRKRSFNHFTNVGRKPDLLVFIEFLDDLTQELTHIEINKSSITNYTNYDSKHANKSHRTLIARSNEEGIFCLYHNNSGHPLSDCRSFSKKPFEERKTFAQERKLCFICLDTHRRTDCNFRGKCPICDGGHCRGMHRERKFDQPAGGDRKMGEGNSKPSFKNACSVCEFSGSAVCSKTFLIKIRSKLSHRTMSALCIIDEQSNASFCDPRVAEYFGITPITEEYRLTTLSGYCSKMSGGSVSGLSIKGTNERNWIDLPPVLTHNNLPDTRNEMAVKSTVRRHSHVASFSCKFPVSRPDVDVLLLVGSNCGEAMRTKCFGRMYPFVHHTPLGWALVGPICTNVRPNFDEKRVFRTSLSHDHPTVTHMFPSTEPVLEKQSRSLDPFDIGRDDEEQGSSQDDRHFMQLIRDGVTINAEGNVEMPLPVKSEKSIPRNKLPVYYRTKNTLDRLKKDNLKLDGCLKLFEEYLQDGHVEEIPTEETEPERACWLPIFPVYHPVKKKPRLVFDSSATFKGLSLNNALYQGPDDNNKLIGVLLRFRHGEIGFSADIQKMFHRFYVASQDRDLLRFYWFKENKPEKGIGQFRAKVHIFGNKPSPAIATFGLRYVAELEGKNYPECYKFIKNHLYVDDALGSTDSEEDAVKILRECRSILSKYNIILHKICSNSSHVLDSFPHTDLAEEIQTRKLSDGHITRTLGIVWHISNDQFSLDPRLPKRPFTKRGILATINAVYDPFGLAAPVVLAGKLIQRKVLPPKDTGDPLVLSCDWDDPLPLKYQSEWLQWSASLQRTSEISVKRCYKPSGFGVVTRRELHCFCDASKDAIGYVFYLRLWNNNDDTAVAFLFANSKVSPRSADTIPRLELGAAMEATQIARTLVSEIGVPIDKHIFYTDSLVVIGYLKNTEKRFTRYVSRRIEEILSFTAVDQWRYIPTKDNIADVATRSHSVERLLCTDWLVGPEFLRKGGEPGKPPEVYGADLPEIRCTASKKENKEENHTERICKFTSNWKKALRIVSLVVQFVSNVRARCQRTGFGTLKQDSRTAEYYLVRGAQREVFQKELDTLQNNPEISEICDIASLSPYIDDEGLLRVGGRLKNSNFPEDFKHPLLLPDGHPVTQMILEDCHKSVQHQGRHLTHGALRRRGYHILHGSKVVKQFIDKCFTCRRLRGHFLTQKMSDLPPDRMEESPPFSNVGLDLFGPYKIHDGKSTRRTASTKKCWGLLITCLVSRAIHVDIVPCMDTSSVRLALRRFYALRGTCRRIRSDRGTNFVGAKKQILDIAELQRDASNHNVVWEMNPPLAQSWGGIWERKVGSIKRILDGITIRRGDATLSRDELSTLFQEAACIVNNTPLWNVSSDPNDPTPISPAMLLTLRDHPNPPPPEEFTKHDLASYGSLRWRRIMYLSEEFWKRWRNHYIQQLQHRHKWKKVKPCLTVGDIVLLKQNCGRNLWPAGRVVSVRHSRDNLVRAATVRITVSGEQKHFERPLSKLVLLAAADEHKCH